MDGLKSLVWVGASKKELKAFPRAVQRDFGHALFTALAGGVDPAAKPMKAYKDTMVMEVVCSYRTDTYRTVYTAKLGEVIFVLHAFQKKSRSGIKTPKKNINLINQRLAEAVRIWREMNQ